MSDLPMGRSALLKFSQLVTRGILIAHEIALTDFWDEEFREMDGRKIDIHPWKFLDFSAGVGVVKNVSWVTMRPDPKYGDPATYDLRKIIVTTPSKNKIVTVFRCRKNNHAESELAFIMLMRICGLRTRGKLNESCVLTRIFA